VMRARLTSPDARRWFFDGGPVLLVAAAGLVDTFSSDQLRGYPTAANVVCALAMGAVLLPRRTRPALTMLAFLVVCSAWWPAFGLDRQGPLAGWLAAMFAFYSLGAHGEGRRDAALALGALVVFVAPNVIGAAIGERALTSDTPVSIGILAALWLIGRTLRQRGRLANVLRRERDERDALATANERARIARELHDVITHSVTVMVVEASAERRRRPDDPEAVESLRSIEQTGRQALTELRRLLGVLRAPGDRSELAPQPTLRELEPMLERLRAQGQDVRMTVVGAPPPELPAGVDLTAYRVVQEALTNVVKHAGEARADVALRYGPRSLEIAVEDDGAGTATASQNGGGGHGIAGMRERVAMVGGSLRAGPRSEGGFEVVASLPLDGASP
jgi:signal transduction histidine kinase